MKNIKQKILDFYNSLSTQKKFLILSVLVIILVIIYYMFIKDNYRQSEINYNNFDIDTVIENSITVYDRLQLQEVNDIISKIIDVKYGRMYVDNKPVTIKDLYNSTVTHNYSKKVSYNKFKNILSSIVTNIEKNNTSVENPDVFIEKVYYYGEYDMYLAKIKGTDNNYIGINLLESTNLYSIIYIQ